MYNEYNWYNTFLDLFIFPLNFWVSDVTIDCSEWWQIIVENTTQTINCNVINWNIYNTQTSFFCENQVWCNIILQNQDPTSQISFGEIIIMEQENYWFSGSISDDSSIFSSDENIRDFYIMELIFCIILIFFIFIKKFFK